MGKSRKSEGKPRRARETGAVVGVYVEIDPALLEKAEALRQGRRWTKRVLHEEALRCLLDCAAADKLHGP